MNVFWTVRNAVYRTNGQLYGQVDPTDQRPFPKPNLTDRRVEFYLNLDPNQTYNAKSISSKVNFSVVP